MFRHFKRYRPVLLRRPSSVSLSCRSSFQNFLAHHATHVPPSHLQQPATVVVGGNRTDGGAANQTPQDATAVSLRRRSIARVRSDAKGREAD